MDHKCDRVVRHLRKLMGNGLVVSKDTLFFAESTYGLGVEELISWIESVLW